MGRGGYGNMDENRGKIDTGEQRRDNDERRNEGSHTFRCADAGNTDCRWEVSGQSAEELMPQIEQHGRHEHSGQKFDRNHVLNAIRERRAA